MSALFISHSSRDSAAATDLVDWLEPRGFRSLFLDFDPELGIPAGRQWEQELYRQLRTCQAVIVLCSEHSMESDWCFVEMTHARALGKYIFPVRIAPCTLRTTLSELQVVDATTDRPAAYERLLHGLRASGLDSAALWDGSRPPYPGLMAFQESDAPVFFGREPDIRAFLDAITRLRRFGDSRMLVCLGASGSGKSSLVRAGVLPRLRNAADPWLCIPPFRPLKRPIDELAMALSDAVGGRTAAAEWKPLAQRLRAASDPASSTVSLGDLLRDLRQRAGRREATIVITVDQLEEALVATGEAAAFFRLLRALATDPDGQALVVCTLRSDFLGALQTHPEAQGLSYETVAVGPLTREGLVQVIEGPAQVAGFELESGLTQMLLADTEAEDGLPLLAFALREMWEQDGGTGRLTVKTYQEKLGGLNGSVARAAEGVLLSEAPTPAHQDALRLAFLAMARIGESGQYLRQAVRWDRLPADIHPLLERFVSSHLLVASSENRERRLEVAHEALFRVWTRAKAWLDADRENLRLRDSLRAAAREWQARDRASELLVHRGTRLEAIEALAGEPRFSLDPVELDYLNAGIQARQEEQRAQDHARAARRLRRRLTIAGLIAALVVVSSLGSWAWVERQEAKSRLANLHWVNAVNERDRNGNHLKAMHHFMLAAALSDDSTDARNAYLAGALLGGGTRLNAILEPREPTRLAAFAKEGVVTWSAAGTSQLWDVETGADRTPNPRQGSASKVVASPLGHWAVLQFGPGVIEVLDSGSGQRAAGLPNAAALPEFSADESRFALRDKEGRLHVWKRGDAAPVAVLSAQEAIRGTVLNADGARIITWGDRRGVRAWNGDTGELLGQVDSTGDVLGAALSPDGRHAVFWSKDGLAQLWTIGQPSSLSLPLAATNAQAPNSNIMGAAFLPGNTRLLTWNYGGPGMATLWEVHQAKEVARLDRTEPIRSARFSRDGRLILTWGDEATARVWRAGDRKALTELRHGAGVLGATFSPDQTRILTWSEDRTARVWDPYDDEPLSLPLVHEGAVDGAAFSSDGRSVLTWDSRATRVWQPDAASERRVVLLQHEHPVLAAGPGPATGEVLTLTVEGTLHRFSNGAVKRLPLEAASNLVGARFDLAGTRAVGWDGGDAVRVWDIVTGKALTPRLQHDKSAFGIQGVAFSDDASRVLSWGDDKTVRLWASPGGKPLGLLRHDGAVVGIHLAADARRVLTWSDDSTVRLWDTDSRSVVVKLPAHDSGVRGAAFLADGTRILTWDGNGSLRVWDANDGRKIDEFSHSPGFAIRGAVVSPDQRRVLAWDAQTIIVWSVTGDGPAQELVRWNARAVRHAAFSADASRVLTAGDENGVVRLWDSRRGYPLSVPLVLRSESEGVARTPDEGYVLAWTGAIAKVWNVSVDPRSPAAEGRRLVQVRSGTQLDRLGDLELVPAKEWAGLRHQGLASSARPAAP